MGGITIRACENYIIFIISVRLTFGQDHRRVFMDIDIVVLDRPPQSLLILV